MLWKSWKRGWNQTCTGHENAVGMLDQVASDLKSILKLLTSFQRGVQNEKNKLN